MAVGDGERFGELDHYDFEYPPDADERDAIAHDAAAELDQERRDMLYDKNIGGVGNARYYR